MSVISLQPQLGHLREAADVVALVGRELDLMPHVGDDGSWEFRLEAPYLHAHARVVAALDRVDPTWPDQVYVDYALAV